LPLPSLLVISQGWGLIDLLLRATFSPAHPLARRDVPLARARAFRGRALREHRRSSGHPPLFFQSFLSISFGGGLVDPLLRASNEHILIVRVPRARGRPGCPLPSCGAIPASHAGSPLPASRALLAHSL